MFFPIAGLVFVGSAALLSRGSRRALHGLGAVNMGQGTSEALDAVERAALRLRPAVNKRLVGTEILYEDADYLPSCDDFNEEVLEALKSASFAESAHEPMAHSAKIAAVQAWALSQIECGVSNDLREEAERPVSPV